jgi:flagellar L-ring protein precursor FlgH
MIGRLVMVVMLLVGPGVLAGCASRIADLGREPLMTPVGSGLTPNRTPMVMQAQAQVPRNDNSFWHDASADLFRDPRAMRVGDVVTVKISIKDKASLDSTSERSRDSSSNHSYDLNYDINSFGAKKKGDATIGANASGKTSTKGEGAITRSESIDLLVAAVVTDVLPNGNLVIQGRQEVRVNFEVRDLTVSGIVRPEDISATNEIKHTQIAEARISYGGRGQITDVQQPRYGQQVMDVLLPF